MKIAALCLLFSGCASLKTGWAKVEWLDGGVVPLAICISKINAEGDIEMQCAAKEEPREYRFRNGGTL